MCRRTWPYLSWCCVKRKRKSGGDRQPLVAAQSGAQTRLNRPSALLLKRKHGAETSSVPEVNALLLPWTASKDLSLQLLHAMQEGVMDARQYTIAMLGMTPMGLCSLRMSFCSKSSFWERACYLFASMATAHVQPNVIHYNAAITSCEKGSQWAAAIGAYALVAFGFVRSCLRLELS